MQQTTAIQTPTTLPNAATMSLHRLKLSELLAAQAGKFVGIDFIKKNGFARSLNGRLGVHKHLAGGEATVGTPAQVYLTVFDVQRRGYRAVNLATVRRVRARNTTWEIVG